MYTPISYNQKYKVTDVAVATVDSMGEEIALNCMHVRTRCSPIHLSEALLRSQSTIQIPYKICIKRLRRKIPIIFTVLCGTVLKYVFLRHATK